MSEPVPDNTQVAPAEQPEASAPVTQEQAAAPVEQKPVVEEKKKEKEKKKKKIKFSDPDYLGYNRQLYADKSLFKEEWLKFCDYPDVAILSFFCGCCMMGLVNAMIVPREKRLVNCLIGTFCGCCCCGMIRSEVQKTVGVENDGVGWNCLMHLCICCNVCSITQEYKSIIRWRQETHSKFKSRYYKSRKVWGNFKVLWKTQKEITPAPRPEPVAADAVVM